MLLCYAMGGGFGPVLRTRAVLAAMGWERDAIAVLAAPGAERVAGDLELIAPSWDDAADPAALGRWIARVVAEREADALLVDALPGGVMGELCGLDALRGLELRHTARLLRWAGYVRRLPGALPHYDQVLAAEPLHATHERALAALAAAPPTPIDVDVPHGETSATLDVRGAPWLVVHTGPAREVRALARVADERRGDAPLHVACPIAVDDLPAGAERIDAVPAAPLYAGAAGIVTAAGFTTVRELAPFRDRHVCVPFDRRLDDQHERARRATRAPEAT